MPSPRIVRIKLYADVPPGIPDILDTATGQIAETVRGDATRFEFGVFTGGPSRRVTGADPLDLTTAASIVLTLLDSPDQDAPVLLSKTVPASDADEAMTEAQWLAGTAQSIVITLTGLETAIPVPGSLRKLWLVLTAIHPDASKRVLSGGWIVLRQDATVPGNTGDPLPWHFGTVVATDRPVIDAALVLAGFDMSSDVAGAIDIPFGASDAAWLWFAIPNTVPDKTRWTSASMPLSAIGGPVSFAGNLFPDAVTLPVSGTDFDVYLTNWPTVASTITVS